MSRTSVFNREMKKYLESDKNNVTKYINAKFNDSRSQNYYGFFDSFLFRYGIISFNASPLVNGNEYVPYINCTKNNIFFEERGIKDLSSKSHSLSKCQGIFAKYLISKFRSISVDTLKEWNSDNNNGLN